MENANGNARPAFRVSARIRRTNIAERVLPPIRVRRRALRNGPRNGVGRECLSRSLTRYPEAGCPDRNEEPRILRGSV